MIQRRLLACISLLAILHQGKQYSLQENAIGDGKYPQVTIDTADTATEYTLSNATSQLNSTSANKANETDFANEIVNVTLEASDDGGLKLNLKSHGKQHNIDLKESEFNISNVPIKLLGMSAKKKKAVIKKLRGLKLMKGKNTSATVAVNTAEGNSAPVVQQGVFHFGNHEFHMKSERPEEGKVRISKRSVELPIHRAESFGAAEGSVENEDTDLSNLTTVTPLSATVELVLVIDYSLWSQMLSRNMSFEGETDAMVNLLLYFAHVVEMMDDLYGNIRNDDIDIKVELAGVIVLTTPTQLYSLVERYKIRLTTGGGIIDASSTLLRLRSWVGSYFGRLTLPPYDHVMLLTGYKLYDASTLSFGVIGLAFTGTICDGKNSTSLVEVKSLITLTAHTAAHELAHSLGASHDGVAGGSAQCKDVNYLMSSKVGKPDSLQNRFIFSCCSQRSFYATIKMKGTCLKVKTKDPNYPSRVGELVTNKLPGEVYDAHDQCYIAFGTAACEDWVYKISGTSKCQSLYCIDPGNNKTCTTKYIAAADGTSCDVNSVCLKGNCVPKTEVNELVNQRCKVSVCYGTEHRCSNGVNTVDKDMLSCYPSFRHCDGIDDCTDGSDEANCTVVTRNCPLNFSACLIGNRFEKPDLRVIPGRCIPDSWVCNGIIDCPYAADEFICETKTTEAPIDLRYQQCGEDLEGKNGTITAPNFPQKYPNNADCRWTVTVPEGHVIVFLFPNSFGIERGPNRTCIDQLKIFNAYNGELLITKCGVINHGEIFSTHTDSAIITFKSDFGKSYLGWSLKWFAVPSNEVERFENMTTVTPADVIFPSTTPSIYTPDESSYGEIPVKDISGSLSTSTYVVGNLLDGLLGTASNLTGIFCTVTKKKYVILDLGSVVGVKDIRIWSRSGRVYLFQAKNILITVAETPEKLDDVSSICTYRDGNPLYGYSRPETLQCHQTMFGRYVKIQMIKVFLRQFMCLAEVKVYGYKELTVATAPTSLSTPLLEDTVATSTATTTPTITTTTPTITTTTPTTTTPTITTTTPTITTTTPTTTTPTIITTTPTITTTTPTITTTTPTTTTPTITTTTPTITTTTSTTTTPTITTTTPTITTTTPTTTTPTITTTTPTITTTTPTTTTPITTTVTPTTTTSTPTTSTTTPTTTITTPTTTTTTTSETTTITTPTTTPSTSTITTTTTVTTLTTSTTRAATPTAITTSSRSATITGMSNLLHSHLVSGLVIIPTTSTTRTTTPTAITTSSRSATITGCGGVQLGYYGTIISPGYPRDYEPNLNCAYVIIVPIGDSIVLNFTDFELESHSTCKYDSVKIYPFGSLEPETVCGKVPFVRRINSPIVTIKFTTDSSLHYQGWRLKWSIPCDGRFDEESGALVSPNFPENYPNNFQCEWTISIPEGLIGIIIPEFNVESSTGCPYDELQFKDGSTGSVIRRHCGTGARFEKGLSNSIKVKFTTDSTIVRSGWKLRWNKISCGEDIIAETGVINSPTNGSLYPSNTLCVWNITVPSETIFLNFTDLDIQYHKDCIHDSLMVKDGHNSAYYIGHYCGTGNVSVVGVSNSVQVIFSTDSRIQRRGWSMSWRSNSSDALEKTTTAVASASCGGERTSGYGVLTSPNYPNLYPHSLRCKWNITISSGTVGILITQFSVEHDTFCSFDRLTFRDGFTGRTLGNHCGTGKRYLKGLSNSIIVDFTTDASEAKSGWRLEWNSIGCGEELSGSKGSLASPSFLSSHYPSETFCLWNITVPSGLVAANMTYFDIQHHPRCLHDSLNFFDGHTGRHIITHCGFNARYVLGESSSLVVLFSTDSHTESDGWLLVWTTSADPGDS